MENSNIKISVTKNVVAEPIDILIEIKSVKFEETKKVNIIPTKKPKYTISSNIFQGKPCLLNLLKSNWITKSSIC